MERATTAHELDVLKDLLCCADCSLLVLGRVIPVVLVQQQRILCITRTLEHNYILPISTVRIQLHVSALYVGHLQVEIFNLQISYRLSIIIIINSLTNYNILLA